jgi:hypothetical protein
MNRLSSILRGALCLGLFVLGLCGGCWAIREMLPFPDVVTVKPKVEHFAVHHDDYDTLFLGSSHIYYQIVPALFDPLAASEGLPTHSFNAGVAGLHPPEDAFYLDCLLRPPPKHLRWVFVELGSVRTPLDRATTGTARSVYWHDCLRLWVLLKRALYVEPEGKKRPWMQTLERRLGPWGDWIEHFSLFLQNETNLGRGSVLTARLIDGAPRPPDPHDALGTDLAGWIATGMRDFATDHDREVAAYEKLVAERRMQPSRRDLSDPVSQQALEDMIANIEKLGATPVLVVPPTPYKSHFFPSPERARKSIVLDFSDVIRFPELYETRHRLDVDHLNTAGAEIFTRLFVRTWVEEMKARRP